MPIDLILSWLNNHPLQLIRRDCQQENTDERNQMAELSAILYNMEELYEFLTPVLPTGTATRAYIDAFKDINEDENPTDPRETADPVEMIDGQQQPQTQGQQTTTNLQVKFQEAEAEITDIKEIPKTIVPAIPDMAHKPLGRTNPSTPDPAPIQRTLDQPRRSPRARKLNSKYTFDQ